jgi:hypothetical protein
MNNSQENLQDTLAEIVLEISNVHRDAEAIGITYQRMLKVAERRGWKQPSHIDVDFLRSRIRLELKSHKRKEKRGRLCQLVEGLR